MHFYTNFSSLEQKLKSQHAVFTSLLETASNGPTFPLSLCLNYSNSILTCDCLLKTLSYWELLLFVNMAVEWVAQKTPLLIFAHIRYIGNMLL